MVSTSFVTANHTVNSTGKLPKNGIVIRKLSFATPGLCRLIFVYCGAIFALPEAFFFGHSGTIFERPRSLSIDYSGAKYVRSALKIAAMQKSLFRVVENSKFLNRLRNGHLKKSAVTGV